MKRFSGMFGAFNGELCFRAKDDELGMGFMVRFSCVDGEDFGVVWCGVWLLRGCVWETAWWYMRLDLYGVGIHSLTCRMIKY